MKIDEDNFISELKKGNPKALDYIYSRYAGLAYKIVVGVLMNTASREDIEECVSDIFVGIWRNASKYNSKITTFDKWLISVSKYKAIDYLRRIRKSTQTIELHDDIAITSNSLEEKIIQANDMNSLYGLINEMEDTDKQIFVRRYILNEKIVDIAEYLGIPRSVVDNRLTRGRKTIKNMWKEIMGGN